jgi:hypothetical protein
MQIFCSLLRVYYLKKRDRERERERKKLSVCRSNKTIDQYILGGTLKEKPNAPPSFHFVKRNTALSAPDERDGSYPSQDQKRDAAIIITYLRDQLD